MVEIRKRGQTHLCTSIHVEREKWREGKTEKKERKTERERERQREREAVPSLHLYVLFALTLAFSFD
jgi:hypothetical protein